MCSVYAPLHMFQFGSFFSHAILFSARKVFVRSKLQHPQVECTRACLHINVAGVCLRDSVLMIKIGHVLPFIILTDKYISNEIFSCWYSPRTSRKWIVMFQWYNQKEARLFCSSSVSLWRRVFFFVSFIHKSSISCSSFLYFIFLYSNPEY